MTDLSSTFGGLAGPIAAVCHDAGATNHLLSWIAEAEAEDKLLPVMEGPAALLWRQYFPKGPAPVSFDEALKAAKVVITGTGWASDIEHRARAHAKGSGIRSIAVVDHWTNYRERFERQGHIILPDEIWVADEHAKTIAEGLFPTVALQQMPDVYLRKQVQLIGATPDENAQFLYALEPIRDSWGKDQPGEFQALDFTMAMFDRLGVPTGTPIRLRPHPSDPAGKYDQWIRRHKGLDIALDSSSSLTEAIARSRWVAGCQTFALVVALEAGRIAFSTLPPWAPRCPLPHRSLIHIRELVHQP